MQQPDQFKSRQSLVKKINRDGDDARPRLNNLRQQLLTEKGCEQGCRCSAGEFLKVLGVKRGKTAMLIVAESQTFITIDAVPQFQQSVEVTHGRVVAREVLRCRCRAQQRQRR